MLTRHTSSEEEKIPYLRKFSLDIRNNTEFSCMKIPLTGMRVDRFVSCENVLPRLQTFPPHPLDWSLNSPLEEKETLLQPVLKSFITFFTIMSG